MKRFALLFALTLTGCGDSEPRHYASDGEILARVCRDGTYVFKYTDGTYHASGWRFPVEDVEKVCQP